MLLKHVINIGIRTGFDIVKQARISFWVSGQDPKQQIWLFCLEVVHGDCRLFLSWRALWNPWRQNRVLVVAQQVLPSVPIVSSSIADGWVVRCVQPSQRIQAATLGVVAGFEEFHQGSSMVGQVDAALQGRRLLLVDVMAESFPFPFCSTKQVARDFGFLKVSTKLGRQSMRGRKLDRPGHRRAKLAMLDLRQNVSENDFVQVRNL